MLIVLYVFTDTFFTGQSMHKLRIGVLMGGKSQEREVSFNSGRTIGDHLDTSRYTVVPLFQTKNGFLYHLPAHFLHRGKISDFEHRLEKEARRCTWESLKQSIDFLYIAQHGRYAEDGSLQGLLEILALPYFGSRVLTSALCMDKAMQRYFLQAAGIKVPQGMVIQPFDIDTISQAAIITSLPLPVIVKPTHEGSSLGISIVQTPQELIPALKKAATVTPTIEQPVLIEELMHGMEFTCIILTDYNTNQLLPLPPTEVVLNPNTLYFDYEQKYMPGKTIKHTPARCTAEQQRMIQQTCLDVMHTLGMRTLARIDGFLTADNTIVITDPNTFAGMDPASFIFVQAAEIHMSHTQLINHLIETELHTYSLLDTSYSTTVSDSSQQNTQAQQKVRVGVLLGGNSSEREISLASGRNIIYKLSPHTYQAIPLFLSSKLELYAISQRLLVHNTTAEIEAELNETMKIPWSELSNHIDFAFIGLHGGAGEDGRVQGALETLGIPYNGSPVLASALCMDKFKTTQLLRHRGLEVPRAFLLHKSDTQSLQHDLPYPLIVKPSDDGCSFLVMKVHNEQELQTAVQRMFAAGKTAAMIEEYINGIELTVGVIGNTKARALPPSMAIATAGVLSVEEKFLPGAGENQTPAPLPAHITAMVQRTVEEAYTIMGCKGYARIDCFYQPADKSPTGKDRVVILEINTLPGLTPATCLFHQAAEIGLRPMEFIDLLVRLGLENHAHLVKVPVPQTLKSDLMLD
jgi:UDP-N-acetylmuramate--alanine ligase